MDNTDRATCQDVLGKTITTCCAVEIVMALRVQSAEEERLKALCPVCQNLVLMCSSRPRVGRQGIILPVENNRFQVVLWGPKGDHPPLDDAGYLAYAESLGMPEFMQVLQSATPLSNVNKFTRTENVRRHYDEVCCTPRKISRWLYCYGGNRSGMQDSTAPACNAVQWLWHGNYGWCWIQEPIAINNLGKGHLQGPALYSTIKTGNAWDLSTSMRLHSLDS